MSECSRYGPFLLLQVLKRAFSALEADKLQEKVRIQQETLKLLWLFARISVG